MVHRHNQTRFDDPTIPDDLATKKYVDSGGGSSPLTTKGDLFGFSTVDARIPIGTNGQRLTADSAQALGLKWETPTGGSGLTFAKVVKSVDETINSSTTMQDDDELLFTPNINKVYAGILLLWWTSPSTPDFKCAFTIPTGATGQWMEANAIFRFSGQDDTDIANVIPQTGSGGFLKTLSNYFRIEMSSTAGTVNFQWAQNVSNASNTTVNAGSTLVVWEE